MTDRRPRNPLTVPAAIAGAGLLLGLAAGTAATLLTPRPTTTAATSTARIPRTRTPDTGGDAGGSAATPPAPGDTGADGTTGGRRYATVGAWLEDSPSGRMLVEQAPVGLEYFGMTVTVSAESEDTIRFDYTIRDPDGVAPHMAAISSSYALELPDADREVDAPHGVRAHAVVRDASGRTVYDHVFDADGPVS